MALGDGWINSDGPKDPAFAEAFTSKLGDMDAKGPMVVQKGPGHIKKLLSRTGYVSGNVKTNTLS